MKKIIALLLVAGTFVFSANAQEADVMKPHKHHHQHMLEMKELNLTPEQKTQLKANRENYKTQITALNKKETLTVKDARNQKDTLRKANKAGMLAILTPEQKDKMAQIKKDRQAKKEAMAEKKLDKMKAVLNLSGDQLAKINADRQAAHQKYKAIKDNDQLNGTQKREQLMAAKEQNKNNLKSILSAEQFTKMQDMKHEGPNRK